MSVHQITHFIGLDGVPVIQIDTQDLDGMLRINLNDSTLYNGDPEKHEAPGIPVELPDEDDERECVQCGDNPHTLSSRDWCDGCEERDAKPKCDECDTHEGDADQQGWEIELSTWPDLKKPVTLCPSCEHNARRSGWEPGQ